MKTDVFAALHLEKPSFARHCTLYGADERSPAAIANMLKQYESSARLVARVRYRQSPSISCVELMDTSNGRDIKLSDLLLVAVQAEVPPPVDINPGSVEYVFVSSVMGDGLFFGQPMKYDSECLEQLRHQMNEYYRSNGVANVTGAQAGDFCCCQNDVDMLYYRARIVRKFAANKYVVSFCACICVRAQGLPINIDKNSTQNVVCWLVTGSVACQKM